MLILPQITSEAAKTFMSPAELRESQEAGLSLMLGPYPGIAAVLPVIWLLIFFRTMDTPAEQSQEEEGAARSGAVQRLWRNLLYRHGVVAQFFNVAAQVCAWTFTIQYAQDVVGIPTEDSGWYLQARARMM